MFTKQHYKAIAEIVKEKVEFAKVFTGSDMALGICKDISKDLADYFAQDNPQFDRDRFLEACGL